MYDTKQITNMFADCFVLTNISSYEVDRVNLVIEM